MTLLIIFLTILLLGYLALKGNVNKIKKLPRPFTKEELLLDPKGTEHYVTNTDGTKIRTIVAGNGPTIVLAHGYGAGLVEWNIIGNRLVKQGYRIIAFDQRGHIGSSIGSEGVGSQQMASDYKAVLEHYDVKDGVLVGHSMGGFLAIQFLLNYPNVVKDRLKGVMIMASFAGDINRDNAQNKVQIPLIKSGVLVSLANTELLGFPFGRSLLGDQPDSAIIEVFLKFFTANDHLKLIPILEAFYKENNYGRLNEINLPCTVIVGNKDKTTPPFHTDNMVSGIKGAKLVKVEGKGHMLNWEAPQEVINEIKALSGSVGAVV